MKPVAWILTAISLILLSGCNLPSRDGSGETGAPPTEAVDTPALGQATLPPVDELPLVHPLALARIDFQDPQNGWAITQEQSGRVLRSLDGGASWRDVTPAGELSVDYSASFTALDARTAWLLIPNPDFMTGLLFRTTDGGLHWDQAAVPFAGGSLQFLDASTGRMLADRGAGAGSQAVEMYQSSDGGASWVSVFHNDPTQAGSNDSLPLSGNKDGLTFVDEDHGFVGGSRPMPGDVYLFASQDGGASWHQVGLSMPPGTEEYMYSTRAPIFTGDNGYLPLTVYPTMGDPYLTFLITSDSGSAWNGDPGNPERIIPHPGCYSFIEGGLGYAWDGGPIFYMTADGGGIWGGLAPALQLGEGLAVLDFTAPGDGFALSNIDGEGRSRLYHTTDGGFSWTAVIP